MASGLLMLLVAVWIFVRTFWGGLPRRIAEGVV